MFGWEKKDMENIGPRELKVYRNLAKRYLEFSNEEINIAISGRILQEIHQPR